MDGDVRWKQRLQNYKKALKVLKSAVWLSRRRELTELEKQGLIQGFEFTFELAWNVIKDYLEQQGITGITGSRGAIRRAFDEGIIVEGQTWLDMVEARNLSSHSYSEETAEKLVEDIVNNYYDNLAAFGESMDGLQ